MKPFYVLILVETILSILLYTIAFILICKSFYIIHKHRVRLFTSIAPSLLIYLACWAIYVLLCLPYLFGVCIHLFMPNAEPVLASYLIFYAAVWPIAAYSAIPVSVIFLTLDRLLFIYFPTYSKKDSLKKKVTIANVLAIFLCFVLNAYAFCQELPLNYIFNRVCILFILLEFFLSFLPQVIALGTVQLFGVTIADYIGPYNVYLAAIDLIVSTTVYYKTIQKCIPISTTLVKVTSSRFT
uniref:G-protein coupled receptors family 1 profile domain-containing protein n=1 Tax=Ditylenchus dipsaci TaxID=166011 RepID=A0A915EP85_9BILA